MIKTYLNKEKYLLLSILFFIILTIFSCNIPFVWDGTFFSRTALHFFENGFSSFIVPDNCDSGNFPLFGVYMAFTWTLFGKSLIVSHFAMLPFLIGIVFEFHRLAKRFIAQKYIPLIFLFLIIEPCFITQSIIMAYDILLIYFFLLSINTLLSKRRVLYAIALCFLALSSMRGLLMVFPFFIIHISLIFYFKEWKISIKDVLLYLIVIFPIAAWNLYHYNETDWMLFSPLRSGEHESFVGFTMFIKQFVFAIFAPGVLIS